MINYILQVVLFQALFLAIYDLFLQNETFFKWNRMYLLATPFLSFIIPILKLESFQKTVPQEYVVQLPEVVLNPQAFLEQTAESSSILQYSSFIFYSGAGIFALLFLLKLAKVLKLIRANKVIKKQNYSLVVLEKKQSAFSFFNYIFINKHLLENKDLQIIQHELVHCKHRHTLDLLYFELLKIVLWFNPLVYVYQKRITLLHEYISDAEVVRETDKNNYFNKLLSETFNVENISFINQFFKHSLIKKRILMITKEKSKKLKQLKYLLIVPLLVGMLFYVSCSDDSQINIEQVENALKEENIPSEGKYFRAKNGYVLFVGTHLTGQVVNYEDYTEKEKEIYNKFLQKTNPKFEMSVVIDENGERVNFMKTDFNPKSVGSIELEEGNDIPFSIIENAPVFPGCEGTEQELKACLQEKIANYVSANFNSELAKGLKLKSGLQKVFVLFTIDKEGNITDIQSRAPHKKLEEEAIRVIASLPKMIPGKQKGEAVGVKYSLPIAFMVNGEKKNDVKTNLETPNVFENVLIIFDGKEISTEEMQKIKPENIKSMEVLKGENAIEKYGDKAKNGAIEITKKE
ncbi:MAG: M56 family metallopeptidase [Lutibacter sp.]